VELEDGEIRLLVQAYELGPMLVAVQRDDLDIAGVLDHVGVREGDARGIHNDARAQASLRNALGGVAEEPAEALLAGELLERRARGAARSPRGVDVDDGGLDNLCALRK